MFESSNSRNWWAKKGWKAKLQQKLFIIAKTERPIVQHFFCCAIILEDFLKVTLSHRITVKFPCSLLHFSHVHSFYSFLTFFFHFLDPSFVYHSTEYICTQSRAYNFVKVISVQSSRVSEISIEFLFCFVFHSLRFY